MDDLCLSLLNVAGDALDRLFVRYHVDPVGLLEILRQSRLRWRFDNVGRMFQGRTVEELETWSGTLDQAADQLTLAEPLLLHEWCDSMTALFADGRELVTFLVSETRRPLYDYVGRLLRATFPESCGRWSSGGEKRHRDRVKQLLAPQ